MACIRYFNCFYEVNFKWLEAKEKIDKKMKILAVLKSAHQKFLENALSQLKILFCEIYYIKQDTLHTPFHVKAYLINIFNVLDKETAGITQNIEKSSRARVITILD